MRARLYQSRWREDASPFQAADSVVEAVSAEMEHRIKEEEVSSRVSHTDMEFVQNFTPPDFQAKILHRQYHLI